jgi:hypothetical protein
MPEFGAPDMTSVVVRLELILEAEAASAWNKIPGDCHV